MDNIFDIEQKASQKYGVPIVNISHWDSSLAFQQHMSRAIVLPEQSLPWNYYYTYSILKEKREQILKNLGITSEQLQSTMGLLLQSSTIAIVNIINLLVHFKRKRLCILQPAYFSVASCCSTLDLEYGIEKISFENNHPQIPINKILAGGYDCIWITSPIFCTGHYPSYEYLKDIDYLRSYGITLIFDESLALPGKELIRSFPMDKDLIAIYSPHKAISINGLKFAIIVCDKFYEDFLEQWVDVFSGALSASNRDAIFHYISPNFLNNCYPAYKAYIEKSKNFVKDIIQQFSFASILPNTEGHYINVFTNLKFQQNDELMNIIHSIIHTSLASLIPASLNGFDPNQGFGFRVNLTGDHVELASAVNRIMQYLDTLYR